MGNLQSISPTVKAYNKLPKLNSNNKPENHTRFVCFSDTHSLHGHFKKEQIPEADVMIHAGDFSDVGKEKDIISFNQWLESLPYKHKIVIAGNHDITFEESSYLDHNFARFHLKSGYCEPCDCK